MFEIFANVDFTQKNENIVKVAVDLADLGTNKEVVVDSLRLVVEELEDPPQNSSHRLESSFLLEQKLRVYIYIYMLLLFVNQRTAESHPCKGVPFYLC